MKSSQRQSQYDLTLHGLASADNIGGINKQSQRQSG